MESEAAFIAPEGVYSLIEEHKPSFLQIHTANSNATLYPTRLSSVNVKFPAPKQAVGGAQGFAQLLGGNKNNQDKDKEAKRASAAATRDRDDGVSQTSSDTPEDDGAGGSAADSSNPPGSPAMGIEQHHLFSQPAQLGKKKTISRPKRNIRTTSSTFITRIQNAEGGLKSLQTRQGEATFLFYNSGKMFMWIEAGAKSREPLARVTFSAYPTCHDVNPSTASHERLDVVIGFHTGDIVWFDPITARYGRFNKQGCISRSPCTAIRWVPSSSTLFLVSHADGTIIVYDKDRDDGIFTPSHPVSEELSEEGSAKEWDPFDSIFVSMSQWHPATAFNSNSGKPEKEKTPKNPVSHWRVSKRGIVDFAFSPDVKHVGAISEDGCLRIIDAHGERLLDCYASYFGALTCMAWSPDGRFVLTGGQDDLLTLFSPWEQRVVARCQGHSSFVASVAFDESRCDGRTYRFGSAGEDNKLILWDFSSGVLHRPKFQSTHRNSMSSTVSLAFRQDRSASYLPSVESPVGDEQPMSRYHPAPSRTEIAVVQPVLVKQMDLDLLTAIAFVRHHIITSTKTSHLKLWIRPLGLKSRRNGKSQRGVTDI